MTDENSIGTVLKKSLQEEMQTSYMDYAMSVIVSRALPDVRDGLKPVQRRILYAMSELNLRSNGAYKKSAATVGDVMAKFHPHGDAPIYDAMVRMAQDFSLRYRLIDRPDATTEELAEIVRGPDFPTAGIIIGREGIKNAYATGQGRMIVRARAHIEEMARAGRFQIVVTELPYQTNKAALIEKMA